MKKILLVGAFALIAQFSFAQIATTVHDFSTQGWGTTQICQPCHTPHNALAVTDAPLWNHEVTTETFTMYSTTTFDGAATISATPTGTSLLCLSCHDGTIALENFGGVTTGAAFVPANANFGTDLSNDHPISFDYTAAAALDAEIWVETTITSEGGTITADYLDGGTLMQCSTCHDVHGTGLGYPSLLKGDIAGSTLCLDCHDK